MNEHQTKPKTISITLRPSVDRDVVAVLVATLLNDPNVIRVKVDDIKHIPRPTGRPSYLEV